MDPIRQDMIQRARQAAVDMIIDEPQTFYEINTGVPPYVQPGMPESYVYVYDLLLNVVAHPNPGTLHQSHASKPYAQTMFEKARTVGSSGWIDYVEGDLQRMAYFELAHSRTDNYYIIVSTRPIAPVEPTKSTPASKPEPPQPVIQTQEIPIVTTPPPEPSPRTSQQSDERSGFRSREPLWKQHL